MMNPASWILLGILLVIVGIVVAVIIMNKKRGKGRCSCCDKEECPNRKK